MNIEVVTESQILTGNQLKRNLKNKIIGLLDDATDVWNNATPHPIADYIRVSLWKARFNLIRGDNI